MTFFQGGVASLGALSNSGSIQLSQSTISAGGTFHNGGGELNVPVIKNGGTINIPASSGSSQGALNVGTGTPGSGYNQFADGILQELIAGNSNYGTIAVQGPAVLNGTLDITLANGFMPTPGETFTILTFTPGGLAGSFANLTGDRYFAISYNESAGAVVLTAEAVPEPPALLLVTAAIFGAGIFSIQRRL